MASVKRGFRSVVAAFSRSRFFRRFGPSLMPPLEAAFAKLNGGRTPLSGVLVPSLVLHTIGAKSGLERDTPLMYCPEPGGRMLITGSNFARETHPAWTSNLIANPGAAVTLKGKRIEVRASRIPEDKLDETWDWIEKQWPGYRGYERASGRTLRIFRLVPTE
ncbi:MAG TPA: nitroreductase/quinone reductase family protein [Galbitalea sp.]|jgi:deazaflavin-dependent oxidoreductase (nitroreductase family)